MIQKLNMSTYYRVARMSQSLNRFMQQALITKTQVASSLSSAALSSMTGVGKNIDIFA